MKIRPLTWEKPNVTPKMRMDFLKLPFPVQAKLIGIHAKMHLEAAEEIMAKYSLSYLNKPLKAIDVWEDMWKKGSVNESNAKEIGAFPKMGKTIDQIGEIFAATMTFWVYHYYSCDLDGGINPVSCLTSKARFFNKDEMAMIDEESGMRYLGQQMKYYAGEVLCKHFPNKTPVRTNALRTS
jgi:hypothetical protein